MKHILVAALSAVCAAAPVVSCRPAPPEGEEIAVLETSMGAMAFELFPEDAPKTVAQFKDLVRNGFYDGTVSYTHLTLPTKRIV